MAKRNSKAGRVKRLERQQQQPRAKLFVSWGDDRFLDDGQILTAEQLKAKYPNMRVIEYEESSLERFSR